MTDLYDQRIDAMKARERRDDDILRGTADVRNREFQYARNLDRRAAYKRKRAPYDVCMCGEDMDKHTESHTPVSMGDYHD